MRRAALLAACLVAAACGKKRPAVVDEVAPDAGPAEVWTPSGTVSPEKVGKEVEDTLQKEHERTLEPRVE